MNNTPGFLARNEFLLRRLHSLSGLIPVGAYMCVHLAVNSSVSFSPNTFQRLVFHIHAIGVALPAIEWAFIFLPIIFHAVYGLVIMKDSSQNVGDYSTSSNWRYTLQRASGMIAFLFIGWHVFHMHGWFHADFWLEIAHSFGGAQFSPYNATSSGASAMQMHWVVPVLYGIGMTACVFHLANGIFTMGITWGLWLTPKAQNCAKYFSIMVFIPLFVMGMLPIIKLSYCIDINGENDNEEKVKSVLIAEEDNAYELLEQTGDVPESGHKHSEGSRYYKHDVEEEE
ncbi:MAG: succinate dehydrogenase [Blastopirellula sp.]|nr:MAG: succinate dehydrogenase [Blastopirellula sp.]